MWYWAIAATLPFVLGPPWCSWEVVRDVPGCQGIPGLILICLIITCGGTDLAFRRIPNWATYPATLWSLTLNSISSITQTLHDAPEFALGSAPVHSYEWLSGTIGLGPSLAGLIACCTVMLLPYKLSKSGAGDVKLAGAIGSLVGFRDGMLIIAMTYVFAGLYVLLYVIWTSGLLATLQVILRLCGAALLLGIVLPPTREQRAVLNQSIPLGPFFTLGTMTVLFRLLERLDSVALADGGASFLRAIIEGEMC